MTLTTTRQPRVVPTWDAYFHSIAQVVATRSKDPDTQCGAVIVNAQNHIISTGYNGAVSGANDQELDWSRPGKYDFILHAEANAVLHATQADLTGCRAYITGFPCHSCLKLLAGKGVKAISYCAQQIAMMTPEEKTKTFQLAKVCGVALVGPYL